MRRRVSFSAGIMQSYQLYVVALSWGGFGAGILYRQFPSRESLVLGVYRKEIDTVVALAPALLAKHPPLQAFRI